MGRYAALCCLVPVAILLGGCATSNGIPPARSGRYPVTAPVVQQSLQLEPDTRLRPLRSPPAPTIQGQPLPLQEAAAPSRASMEKMGISAPHPAAPSPAPDFPHREAVPQPRNFPTLWQQDLVVARHGSAGCAAMAGAQKTSCWQDVATWAKGRAGAYGQLATHLSGARSQQVLSAMKFFAVTSQWASACSALSTMACAQSPLIAKMQQWKASVGLPVHPG